MHKLFIITLCFNFYLFGMISSLIYTEKQIKRLEESDRTCEALFKPRDKIVK